MLLLAPRRPVPNGTSWRLRFVDGSDDVPVSAIKALQSSPAGGPASLPRVSPSDCRHHLLGVRQRVELDRQLLRPFLEYDVLQNALPPRDNHTRLRGPRPGGIKGGLTGLIGGKGRLAADARGKLDFDFCLGNELVVAGHDDGEHGTLALLGGALAPLVRINGFAGFALRLTWLCFVRLPEGKVR